MAGSGTYKIVVNGILNDSQIRAQLSALEAEINKSGLAGLMGTSGKGGKNGKKPKSGSTAFGVAGEDAKKSKKNIEGFTTATKKARMSLLDVGKKVAAFGAVTSAIQLATSGMTDMVSQVKTVDDSLTELKKVSSLSADGLKAYTKQAGEAGKATGRTTSEMIDAATEFVKMGKTEKQALGLAKLAT